MPTITNTTLKAECARLAKLRNEKNETWSQQDSAIVCLRTILNELGLTAELGDDYKAERQEILAVITPLFTASKNYRNTYLASTVGEDGKPLMEKDAVAEKQKAAEYV